MKIDVSPYFIVNLANNCVTWAA